MPKDIFAFKQFVIYQPYHTVMKVSTDSVLLGCFAHVIQRYRALDIGCGTGILSLMLAQKNPQLRIIGIDIHPDAYQCAAMNVEHSRFKHQIQIIHTSLKNFLDTSQLHFDVIVSNPPYFSNSLKSPSKDKNTYRHQSDMTYIEIIQAVSVLLTQNGSFYVCIPYYEQNRFDKELHIHKLYKHREMAVFSTTTQQKPYLFIKEIRKSKCDEISTEILHIRNEHNQYTSTYLEFTKEYYLFAK